MFIVYVTGCTGHPNPSRLTWTSTPAVQKASNAYFEVSLAPVKLGNNYFAAFQITIVNKTDGDLFIDWNKTLYLYDKKSYGVFVFKGIEPSTVKSATVPPDLVPAGGQLLKEVMPYKLVAWMPIEKGAPGDESIRPGIIPKGDNGISLCIKKGKKIIVEKLFVQITGE